MVVENAVQSRCIAGSVAWIGVANVTEQTGHPRPMLKRCKDPYLHKTDEKNNAIHTRHPTMPVDKLH